MTRLLLCNKDVQIITGKGPKASYRLICKIKAKIGKDPGIPLTLHEFCDYMRLRVEVVRQLLK
jgi:hypothetical protein